MQLIEVDKARYRKNLNIIIVGFIASLLVLSLGFGTLLINMFSSIGEVNDLAEVASNAVDGEQQSNFKYNLLGVILALLANAAFLHSAKGSDFFKEVYYVWQIKHIQNLVYRKLKKIKLAGKSGEETALVILSFYYQSQLQIYKLDDNTITIETIEKHLQEVNDTIAEYGLTIDSQKFDKDMIKQY